MCELIGVGYPTLLNISFKRVSCYCALRIYNQYMLCIVVIVDRTHVHHVVQNIRTYRTPLLLLTASI